MISEIEKQKSLDILEKSSYNNTKNFAQQSIILLDKLYRIMA